MPKATVTTCSHCGRFPPQVQYVTSYSIQREKERAHEVDLCNEHEETLFELLPELRPRSHRRVTPTEERAVVDPRTLPPPTPETLPPEAPRRRPAPRKKPG